MCTYNISIDNAVMEKVRPAIASGVSEQEWLQHQVNIMIQQILESQNKQNRVYIEDGEVKYDIKDEYIDVEEARQLLHEAIDLEYSLP
ncbi:MAG: hypothetical protein II844_03870 [Prevotella sp.]|nr:hypothetical protein [Prevotella sp.]